MPAATTRAELLAVTEREWAKLEKLIADIPPEVAETAFEGDVSIRDTVAHRAHWIGLFFQWLGEGAAARMPDHGVTWRDLKAYNAGLRTRYRRLDWAEARERLEAAHGRLLGWIEAADDTTLYGVPMAGGNGRWTTGRYAEAAGASHYRSAAKVIRAGLKRLADTAPAG